MHAGSVLAVTAQDRHIYVGRNPFHIQPASGGRPLLQGAVKVPAFGMCNCAGYLAGLARGASADIYKYLLWFMHGILLPYGLSAYLPLVRYCRNTRTASEPQPF